jgi:FkbM family methyltransferase
MIFSYAQNLEDVLLYRALNCVDNGFYIDVGAYHPLTDSITKLFYDLGWNGINIEPSRARHEELVRERPRDINLNIAASDKEASLLFHEFTGTGLSTTVDHIADQHKAAGFENRSYEVAAVPLAEICQQYVTGPIHFLKIDVEGAEREVLRGADFARFRPWIIVIEATAPLSDTPTHSGWEDIILEQRYEFMVFDGLNRFYAASERDDVKQLLVCPADSYQRAVDFWTRSHLEVLLKEREAEIARFRDKFPKGVTFSEVAYSAPEQITIAQVAGLKSEIDILAQQLTSTIDQVAVGTAASAEQTSAITASITTLQLQMNNIMRDLETMKQNAESWLIPLLNRHGAAISELRSRRGMLARLLRRRV